MSDTCIICTESFNKKERLKIKCQYCDFESCRKCSKTYLLNETKPKCMNNDCDKEWTRQFLSNHFTHSFLNKEYKKHREDTLFNTERALMPATQPLVENQMKRERIFVELEELRNQIKTLNNNTYILNAEYYRLGRRNTENIRERSQFIRACPDAECRGFLSSQWKCGICEKWTCPSCHLVKGVERDSPHECNPDDVLTASLISNDTKSCPSCGTGIFKIDGCDQMWCTQCNTGFSWRTGIVETNHIHNPHYFEWLRRNGDQQRQQGGDLENGPCRERVIDNLFVRSITNLINCQRIKSLVPPEELVDLRKRVYEYCENISHLHRVQFPYYQFNVNRNNEDLRIQYMRNMITEEKFKFQLQQSDKKSQKMREISNILNMVILTTTDILHRFHDELNQPTWTYNLEHGSSSDSSQEVLTSSTTPSRLCFQTLKEIDRILEYSNECLADISKTYNSKQWMFNEKIRLV